MIRIVCTVEIRQLLAARGIADEVIERIKRHGEVRCARDTYNEDGSIQTLGQRYFDIIVERDANDLPPAVVTFLRNRPEVVYVAEWDGVSPTGVVHKGSDPGIHQFAGWPV